MDSVLAGLAGEKLRQQLCCCENCDETHGPQVWHGAEAQMSSWPVLSLGDFVHLELQDAISSMPFCFHAFSPHVRLISTNL